MHTDLVSISKLFNETLFRIPDYQRGYAWTETQLEDFWTDLNQINSEANHYTGVLTLEPVPSTVHKKWEEDAWIIESKGFTPFYIVDGQQRITTIIILLNCITETLSDPDEVINYTTRGEIQKRFLFETKDGGVSRSYVFGYEKDNPSYEYLKTKIFEEASASDRQEETVYTNNLSNAKSFFTKKLYSLDKQSIEDIYKKVTHRLLFNIFSISDEVDVCVAFETMNNRGKPLSYLELLKNRLIYLSIKLDVDQHEALKLRTTINDAWKTIYHNLGRNKSIPLDDDFFLRTHHFINYLDPAPENADDDEGRRKQRRLARAVEEPEYRNLLNEIFTLSSINEMRALDGDIDTKSLKRIHEYAMSLQRAVKEWYLIFNPLPSNDPQDQNFWLSKINKIASEKVYPILLSIMLATKDNSLRVGALKEMERLLFLERILASYYNRDFIFYDLLRPC